MTKKSAKKPATKRTRLNLANTEIERLRHELKRLRTAQYELIPAVLGNNGGAIVENVTTGEQIPNVRAVTYRHIAGQEPTLTVEIIASQSRPFTVGGRLISKNVAVHVYDAIDHDEVRVFGTNRRRNAG